MYLEFKYTCFNIKNKIKIMKYKLGDTVKIVANKACSLNKIGDIGVVYCVDNSENLPYRVEVDNRRTDSNCTWQHESDIELIESITPNN